MNIRTNLLIYCGFLVISIACNSNPFAKQKEDSHLQLVSDSYKPPVFAYDNREEKIKQIAPAIQQLIEEHARARNIPGITFGNLTYITPWPLTEIRRLLFETIDIQPRQLPVSDILIERQEQIAQLIQSWDTALETEILAENFYLDKLREHRMSEIKEMLNKAGAIQSMVEMEPLNQLRGSFKINNRKWCY